MKGILDFDFATATHWHMYERGNWQLPLKKTLKVNHGNTISPCFFMFGKNVIF